MAVHTIMLPAARGPEFSHDLRSIVWDDEAGTVEGDHPAVGSITLALASDKPVYVGHWTRSWRLTDPGRNAAEMLTLLYSDAHPDVIRDPLRSTLPPVFDGVEVLKPQLGEYAPGSATVDDEGNIVGVDETV